MEGHQYTGTSYASLFQPLYTCITTPSFGIAHVQSASVRQSTVDNDPTEEQTLVPFYHEAVGGNCIRVAIVGNS